MGKPFHSAPGAWDEHGYVLMNDLKAAFEAAVADALKLPRKPGNTTLLSIYALYKQATAGDVKGERPEGFDLAGAAKFDAWEELAGMSREDAMRAYVELINTLKG